MNDVTSVEVSKKLYGLSGWDSSTITYQYAIRDDHAAIPNLVPKQPGRSWPEGYWTSWPAYSLGYLLRKLPARLPEGYLWLSVQADMWVIGYVEGDSITHDIVAGNPQDAAAKLAVELFKQGVLTGDGDE